MTVSLKTSSSLAKVQVAYHMGRELMYPQVLLFDGRKINEGSQGNSEYIVFYGSQTEEGL